MKDLINDIEQLLKILKLKVCLINYQAIAEQSEKENHSHLQFLHELILREAEQRQQQRIESLIKAAKLPRDKLLSNFELFPRLCFRQAYDALRAQRPVSAGKYYLKLLQLAKIQSEQQVIDALELLLEEKQTPTPEAVKSLIDVYRQERLKVRIHEPNLADYDQLLSAENTLKKEMN